MPAMALRGGYPPVPVRPEDRSAYLAALETASTTDDLSPFHRLMSERLADTLAAYVAALREGAE
jgi:hypothetical protein